MSGSRSAVIFDFGGVLTSSLLAAFEEFRATLGNAVTSAPDGVRGPEGAAFLVAHEVGRSPRRSSRWPSPSGSAQRALTSRRPARRAFRAACDALGVPPEQCVMVDDQQLNIDAAARIGMAGVVHTDARTTERELRELLHDQQETA